MSRLLHVVGARPNFMKVAPVMAALAPHPGADQILLHTGQHYDRNMSEIFFRELDIPQPDINLGVGSGTHAQQTAQIISRFEKIVHEQQPNWVFVYGDVNSTVAAALVCAKLGIRVAHIEAGLRSFDRSMPEEINRVLTDQIADLLFTPSKDGDTNLQREGVPRDKIRLVGNVMIDTLVRLLPLTKERAILNELPGCSNNYCLVTLHRPSNVDSCANLTKIMRTLDEVSHQIPVIFPVHPRTRAQFAELRIAPNSAHFRLIEPLGYLDFLALQQRASVVITDSGGIQEETTFLGVPCLTLRENTERPITVEMGTNLLVGHDMQRLIGEVETILTGNAKRGQVPPLWDGKAAERIAAVFVSDVI